MFENYLKIAWRNLLRHKAFSAINISGLALGMSCSLLIMLWVHDELNIDGFHVNGKQLYQVYERNFSDGKVEGTYLTQGLLADELKKAIPELQYASSLEQELPYTFTLAANGKTIKLNGSYSGSDFFRMFSFPLLQGNTSTALNTPNGITISRKTAEMFFGSTEKAISKIIRYENREALLVTAVFENFPLRSTLQFDFLRNWEDYAKQNAWVSNWESSSPYTFVQLRQDADPVKVQAKMKDFIHRYKPQSKASYIELDLQPFTQKYLHSTFKNGRIDGGRMDYVRLYTLVAVFILLIACINFMNLATARSTNRAKEVGIRKVVGALRSSLVAQFIGEALLLTFFAIIIAVCLSGILLPAFNNLTGKQLALPVRQPVFWAFLMVLLIVTGFVSGSYPALFLSSLNPNKVLKGSLTFSTAATLFRKGLVVFQFSLSIILIIGMIIIYRQIAYVQTKNPGYDRENLVYIPIEGNLINRYGLFKEKAGKLPGIVSVSNMKGLPTVIEHHVGDVGWPGKDPNMVTFFADATVGYDFVKTMNLKLKEGHDFSKDFGTDSTGYLLNETAVKKIGYENPVGQQLSWGNKQGKVIGVLKDFHFASLHTTIEPLIIRLADNHKWGSILIRTQAGKTKEALTGLENICKELNPDYPFTYQFTDLEYAKLYHNEELISKLTNCFAFLAIFISCLGLFGLATFIAEQRKKEIGIRKVLGAGILNIVAMLSTVFVMPVFIASLIAFPVAWWLMSNWLDAFAYRIDMSWGIFFAAGFLALFIALITTGFQAIKAAIANPVKSLRTE